MHKMHTQIQFVLTRMANIEHTQSIDLGSITLAYSMMEWDITILSNWLSECHIINQWKERKFRQPKPNSSSVPQQF